jgi:hypothetical protein
MIELSHPGQLAFAGQNRRFDALELSLYPFNGQRLIKFSFRFVQPQPSQETTAYAGLPSSPEGLEYLLAMPGSIAASQETPGSLRFLADDGSEAQLEVAAQDIPDVRARLQSVLELPPPGPPTV